MTNIKINQWLESGEYQTDIDSVLTRLVRNSEFAKSEAETASGFERELYYLIRSKLNVEINIDREQEIGGISHTFKSLKERTSGRGRLDAVVNNLVIEYKHYSKLKSIRDQESAYQQVKDYLIALYKQDKICYDAILTDGLSIAYFSYNGQDVKYTSLKPLSISDIDIIIKAIINNNTKKFEPTNIVKDFSISIKSKSISKELAIILYNTLINNISNKTSMLYAEWKEHMHLSVDDNGKSQDIEKRRKDLSSIFLRTINDPESEYKGLFALQTTYSIIVKLVACKVIDRLNFNNETNEYHDLTNLTSDKLKTFFQNMEDGYSYANMNIRNFLEGDFFSWYTDNSQWNDILYNNIKEIIIVIDQYSAFSIEAEYEPIDIFKDLYMSMIPQSVRHSMGEYYTPEWLADSVVSKSLELINKDEWNAIDPCCGSGIFIITLIKKIVGKKSLYILSNEEKEKLLEKILLNICGIDINPLSVLSARVSFFLAIHKLGHIENIEIPIYLGDSAIVPSLIDIDDIPCYSYSIDNLKCQNFRIVLPVRMVKERTYGKVMYQLQALVKTNSEEVLYSIIVNHLTDLEKKSNKLLNEIRILSKNLIYLHVNNWDGIWIRIATNFMMIARLDTYDLIVGNPPWVKWEHLPSAYTRKIKNFCDVRHIFCNDGGVFGGAQLNICALISNVTATNWLKKDGILAFLMPDSLMSQNSYEEFRNFYINNEKTERLYLQYLDQWKAPLRPFRVGEKAVMQDFNTYYWGKSIVDYKKGIPVRTITRSKQVGDLEINNLLTYREAKQYLSIGNAIAKQLSIDSTAFTYISNEFDFTKIIGNSDYNYRTGVESTPFEIFKLIGYGKSSKKGYYRFKNKILKTSRYKVNDIPEDGWDFPTELIYPMVEGPSIKPFEFNCENNFHIIPYTREDTKSPISIIELSKSQSELAIYFAKHKDIIDKQSEKSKLMHRGSEFYALSKIGSYTFAPYIVAVRDNTQFCAAVIHPTVTPWGELKQSICVKHTIIISQDINNSFISEDEAYYINGVLNSSIVVEYIHSTFKKNGFSLNKSHLFLPKYDSSNNLFFKIVKLSKKATLYPLERTKIMDELTVAYLELCNALNNKE